ncbi:hypothetical protein GCM10011515_16460 [Tsuneonella deserti]|uniref:SURF1-like protein n=1 Tax=Tsuneonella deserti TaxID=2035528 RepID=A0ABQ1SA83_9SPHN|nr:hypothetical protein GCM10011515_16460 [Tsuneonella deserti]
MLATLLVGLAVATMIALGFWQLGRARERDAGKQQMVAHSRLPVVEYPYGDGDREDLMFRRLSATCDAVNSWEVRGGEAVDGRSGWRHIATCISQSNHAIFKVDMGISSAPDARPAWTGGSVVGRAVHAPDTRGIVGGALRRKVARPLMIVSETPAPGLSPSRQPDPSEETNSSWSYAGQWFLFALTALVIYVIALRRRWRESA